MPPFREESMCTQLKQRSGTMSPRSESSMDDVDLGQNVQNGDDNVGRAPANANLNANRGGRHGGGNDASPQRSPQHSPSNHGANPRPPQRSSPVRMRHRGQGVSSPGYSRSIKTKNGRRITNINRINVINNFGSDAQGAAEYFSTPWNQNGRRKKRQDKSAQWGWFFVRAVLVLMMVFWFGMMVTVVRNAHDDIHMQAPPSSSSTDAAPQSKAEMERSRWKKLSEHMIKAGIRGTKVKPQPLAATPQAATPQQQAVTATAGDTEKEGEGSTTTSSDSDESSDGEQEPASIFELSMFGNQSPSDFQLYTPHAPSCSKDLDADDVSFTLVSQLSEDRVWMVQYHCERWGDNPMSIVVFTDRTAADVKSELVRQGCSEEHVTVQTVSPTKYDPTGTEYPVNLLRNIAFAAVRTTHIVYADVDFWPSSDLHSTLTEPRIKARFASDPKLATVVPVFQMLRRCKEYKDCRDSNVPSMPKRKNALFSLIKKKQASTFDPTNVGGHGSTKYITWRDQEPGTFVDLPCIKSNRYEPYLAFRYCRDLPPFQEGFTGYGKNKMTWVMQLRRAGYLFSQLGGVFLVHYPHLNSQARMEWDKKPKKLEKARSLDKLKKKEKEDIDWGSFKRARVDALFLDFKEWLDGTVEDESRVPMCEDALNDDVRLWVHTDKQGAGSDDDDAKKEGDTDDGKYFEEYNDYVDNKEAYDKCEAENGGTSDAAPADCFRDASDFIESSILWSLVGAKSGYLGPSSQMQYLVEAEKCATRFLEVQRRQQTPDGGDYSFQKLVADLYTNMAVVAKNSRSKSIAETYINKALALNPNYESAQKILAQLSTMEEGEDEEEESSPENSGSPDGEDAKRSSENVESSDGQDVERSPDKAESSEGKDAEEGGSADEEESHESIA